MQARCRRVFGNAHTYHINAISISSDQETFISSDDLRVNLWHLDHTNQSFNVVDIKPPNMEDLTEVHASETAQTRKPSADKYIPCMLPSALVLRRMHFQYEANLKLCLALAATAAVLNTEGSIEIVRYVMQKCHACICR